MKNSTSPGRKPVQTIYEINVYLDDGKKFVFRVNSADEIQENLKAIAATGYMDCAPGKIELFPAHRIRSVVAYGADLNIKKQETTVE